MGDIGTRVAVIGPAGGNLVKFACINTECSRNSWRTGMGAIFGSKNLKAVAINGSHDLPVHDMDALTNAADRAFTAPIKTGPHAGELLDREYFESALTMYYEKQGWDENGVPIAFTA